MSEGPVGGEAARAEALLAGGLADAARDAALRALRDDPFDSAARYTLARSLLRRNEAEEAQTHLRGLLADEPQNVDALRLYALTSLRTGRPSLAVQAAHTAVRVDPRAWQSHAVLAQVEAHANGRSAEDRAIAAAETAVKLAPEVAGPHAVMGEVCLRLGRYRHAEKALRDALAIHPHDADTLQNLGAVLEARGRAAAAVNLFGDLAGAQPANPVHTRNIGFTFSRWVGILIVVTMAWVAVVLRVPLLALAAPQADEGTRTTYLLLAAVPPCLAIVGALVFAARSRHRFTSLWVVLRREATPELWVVAAVAVTFALFLMLPFLRQESHAFVTVTAAAVLGGCVVVALRTRRRRAREQATAEPPLAEGERARPLTFREDLARAQSGLPAPRGVNGKPVMQPWLVGPVMYVAFVCSVLSLIPLVGLALGLGGFLISNAAWAHLRHAGRPRLLPLVGQILGALGLVIGVVTAVILVVQRG